MKFAFKFTARSFRARRRSLVRFTAIVAVAGIAAGVAGLIFARALGRGFQEEIQSGLLANTPHISIFRDDGGPIADASSVATEAVKIANVADAKPVRTEQVLLSGPNSIEYSVMNVSDEVDPGETESGTGAVPEIDVGIELAGRTGITDASPAVIIRIAENGERIRVGVRSIFQTGLFEYDSIRINISPQEFSKLSGAKPLAPTAVAITLKDPFQSDATAGNMRRIVGSELRVMDWREANRPLFAAMSLERKAAFTVIILIILIAALNITTTLALLVGERRLDIAVLRTCGATSRNIVEIFLFEGMLIGIVGVAAGVLVGISTCFAANYFRLISLAGEVYMVEYVPLRTSAADVIAVALAALLICAAATVYPAFRAGQVKPAENLRNY